MNATAQAAAAKGAALLDEEVPGWAGRIDLSVLDIGSCSRCVLGQLYNQYAQPIGDPYAIGLHQLGLSVRTAVEHGFTVIPRRRGVVSTTLGQLGEAWANEVRRRVQVPA